MLKRATTYFKKSEEQDGYQVRWPRRTGRVAFRAAGGGIALKHVSKGGGANLFKPDL